MDDDIPCFIIFGKRRRIPPILKLKKKKFNFLLVDDKPYVIIVPDRTFYLQNVKFQQMHSSKNVKKNKNRKGKQKRMERYY